MGLKNVRIERSSRLRARAEAVVRNGKSVNDVKKTDTDVQKVLHELKVHQIELEMQNEELIKANYEVELSRDKFHNLYDFAPVAYFTLDSNGLILEVNYAGCLLFERERKNILNRMFYLYIPVRERDMFYLFLKRVFMTDIKQVAELTFVDKENVCRYLQIEAIISWNDKANDKCALVAVMDVTKQKKAEEILQRSNDELEQLVKKGTDKVIKITRQMERSKRLSDIGMLAATVAHELRSPLGAMKLAIYNIKRKFSEPCIVKHIEVIDNKITESVQVIENLLACSRIQSPNFKQMNPIPVLKECLNSVREKYDCGHVVFEEKYETNGGTTMEADPVHMKILFSNVIENAYQSLSGNKGKLIIAAGVHDEKTFKIAIGDNGIGIDAKDHDKVFEPFFTNKTQGTGLGLYICKQLVDLHKGSITLQSKRGVGTTFVITIPIKQQGGANAYNTSS